ncbi:MAG: hemolysin family protein [Anaerolineales bacterium]|jgi:putative hemolysin
MMDSIALEMLIILLLILLNGLFALAEIAILSARRPRLLSLEAEGVRGAKAALSLAEQPTRFLSTIQSGITLIGVLAGAFGGATIADELYLLFEQLWPGWSYNQAVSVFLVVAAITYLSLVIGELVPKQLALVNPERFAVIVAPVIQFAAHLASPFVRILSLSTRAIMRIFPISRERAASISEAEILYMLEQGAREGVFFEDERDMVQQVLDLDMRSIQTVMTPRLEIDWLDIEDPIDELKAFVIDNPQAAYPAAKGDLDEVVGVVRAEDLLSQSLQRKPFNIEEILRPPLFVPESISVLNVLQQMRSDRAHIALVFDEYTGLNGLVTLTDILESIAGDIPLPEEPIEKLIVSREDGTLLVDGRAPIFELEEALDRDLQHELLDVQSQTIAGLVMALMQRIPSEGDRCTWAGVGYEIVDMDGVRVDKVLVKELEEPPSSQEA